VSERGHYSLGKAADILGIGRRNLVAVETDAHNKVRPDALARRCDELTRDGYRVMAIVGVAGSSETGNVDPLNALADIAQERGIHFHVDSAWGGPTLFSRTHRPLLAGIERADSVTLDAHKQLYVPMGAGLCVFRQPETLSAVEHHAEYIIRKGSKDLGSHSVEGSRPGMAVLVHAGLHIIARGGYELLIDQGIAKAKAFADMIRQTEDFELISEPELNILTYRYVPQEARRLLASDDADVRSAANALLNALTRNPENPARPRQVLRLTHAIDARQVRAHSRGRVPGGARESADYIGDTERNTGRAARDGFARARIATCSDTARTGGRHSALMNFTGASPHPLPSPAPSGLLW